jgi:hypothetical protein
MLVSQAMLNTTLPGNWLRCAGDSRKRMAWNQLKTRLIEAYDNAERAVRREEANVDSHLNTILKLYEQCPEWLIEEARFACNGRMVSLGSCRIGTDHLDYAVVWERLAEKKAQNQS